MVTTTFKRHELSFVLNDLIENEGISITELARRTQIPQPTIQRITTGLHKNPREVTLMPIANYFGVSLNQLKGIEPIVKTKKKIKSLPILEPKQVLTWPNLQQKINQHIISDLEIGNFAFAIHMPDTSMQPLIPKDSILLIDPNRTPHHGSFVIFKTAKHDDILVRQLIIADKQYLKPVNPELSQFKMHELKPDDTNLGTVIEVRLNCE